MIQDFSKIKCPNCNHGVDVNDILYHQLEDKLKKGYQVELAGEQIKWIAVQSIEKLELQVD